MRILECCTCFFFVREVDRTTEGYLALRIKSIICGRVILLHGLIHKPKHQSDTTVIQKTNAKQFGRDDSWRWGKESEGTAMHV